jgi:hypothetical protein
MESEWQNRATLRPSAHSLAACLSRLATLRLGPATAGGGARAARLYPFLNFSIWTDEVQPYKSSQRLVKFQSGTNIKCLTVTYRRVLLIY